MKRLTYMSPCYKRYDLHPPYRGNSREVIDRLAAYEDTELEPGEIIEMNSLCGKTYDDLRHRLNTAEKDLARYREAETDGRLVVIDASCKDCLHKATYEEETSPCKKCVGYYCLIDNKFAPSDTANS